MNALTPRPPKPEALAAPLARLMSPLVRLMIHAGFTFPMFADLLRTLYVTICDREFRLPDKAQTDSRISLMTGVHRKEVRRLREEGMPAPEIPDAVSLGARVVALWAGAAPYVDADGRPLPLPRASQDGEPSFESLVASVTKDVRPRAVLDEWLRQGVIRARPDGLLELDSLAYLPADDDERLFYFGRNLHDHIAAAAGNVIGGPRSMDRSVHYDGLSEAGARRLEAFAREAAMSALLATNAEALRIVESDEGGETIWRGNFGVYVYVDKDAPAIPPPDPADTD